MQAPLSSPADDAHGQLRYIVEVADLQITAEAEAAQGRLLLAARSARLRGLHLPDAGLNVTALALEQARRAVSWHVLRGSQRPGETARHASGVAQSPCGHQRSASLLWSRPQVSAYVTQLDIDPDAPVLWLQPTPDGYQLPPGLGTLPFRCGRGLASGGLRCAGGWCCARRAHDAPMARPAPPAAAAAPQARVRSHPDQPAAQQAVQRRRRGGAPPLAAELARQPPAQPQPGPRGRAGPRGGAAAAGAWAVGMWGSQGASGLPAGPGGSARGASTLAYTFSPPGGRGAAHARARSTRP